MILRGRDQTQDLRLKTDVCVVGSGAGGAMMARELSAAGLSVVVLEMGAHSGSKDFNRLEAEMLELLFQDRGARATRDLAVRILQGHGVGGSTVHNTCLCKRTPPEILDMWARDYAVEGASPADMEPAFLETEAELSVTELSAKDLNENNKLFKRGCDALGYRSGFLRHNREGCIGSGYCELGCPYDGKQNALKVLIPKALEQDATVVSDAKALKVHTRRGRAVAVSGALLDANGARHASFRVEAKAICLAGSAIGSAALHLQSALPDPSGRAGHGLRVHPGAIVAGEFEDDVLGWKGIPQSYECTELLDLNPGAQDRVWLVPVFAHPIGTAVSIPGFGPAHAEMMRGFRRMAALTAMVHDETEGRVTVERNGRIRIDYTMNDADREQLRRGLVAGGKILLAAGAKRVLIPYESEPEWVEDPAKLEASTRRGIPNHGMPVTAVHPMGTLPMGEDPTRAVVSSRGEHHAVPGLFVCDGSLFPTSLGVPPQISIYSFARHLAPYVAEACG